MTQVIRHPLHSLNVISSSLKLCTMSIRFCIAAGAGYFAFRDKMALTVNYNDNHLKRL